MKRTKQEDSSELELYQKLESNVGFYLFFLDNFYKVEGAKDALICGNGSDAG